MFIRKDDTVVILAGDDKGKRGKVLRVLRAEGKLVVEGINRVYKHLKPSRRNPQGGRLSKEMPVDASNVALIDPQTNERFVPHVIEPAAGLTRGVLALLCEAYTVDPSRPSGVYLNFHPSVAPKKAAILPLTAKDQHPVLATKLYMTLRDEFAVDLDIKQNIGKRYARQDEIGTPYCFTIDDQTVADGTVTVRERNTMKQERIAMDSVAAYLREKIKRV